MIKTSRGDYKFPGGALEENEIPKEALAREVKEESGYKDCVIIQCLGKVVEKRKDKYDPDLSFNMISEYYLCTVGAKGELELSENEKRFHFQPQWININTALDENNKFIAKGALFSDWVYRETKVLKHLSQSDFSNGIKEFHFVLDKLNKKSNEEDIID